MASNTPAQVATSPVALPRPQPQDALESFQSPIIKDYELMLEYKRLKTSAPSGVYVAPSFNDVRVWYGFIIVHQGLYKDGMFKFRVGIPEEYPAVPPTVQFLSEVYHPFVHQKTMNMHLGWAVKRWTPPKHCVLYVLKRLKKMFYVSDFAKFPAVWPIAKKESLTDPKKFEAKARRSVKLSLLPDHLYQAPTQPGASIRLAPPHRAHRVFFENYCKSRGLEHQPAVDTAAGQGGQPGDDVGGGGGGSAARGRSQTQLDDLLFQDAKTHSGTATAAAAAAATGKGNGLD